jgi:hypothetical protein
MSIGSHHQKIDCVSFDISFEDLSSRGCSLGNNFKLGFDAVRGQMLDEGFSGFPLHRCFVIGRRVLMYVFSYSVSPAATSDRAEWRLLPTVVFQEFSNEERCRAAKSTLEGSLKEAGAKLKSGLEDLKSLGKADPTQIIIAFNVECLPK